MRISRAELQVWLHLVTFILYVNKGNETYAMLLPPSVGVNLQRMLLCVETDE